MHSHTPEQDGIVERVNNTDRKSVSDKIIADFGDAEKELSKTIWSYNFERRHPSL
ncbi:MAG: integrase core domain-containing protein [Candidatus Parvarchaeota archaeon]